MDGKLYVINRIFQKHDNALTNMESLITYKSKAAAKWSVVTEIVSKIVSPIANMILARLLTPDAFGMVATVTMIVTFADLFSDAGFSKYLVQHKYNTEKEEHLDANVCFWTNFMISVIIWFLIFIFRNQIAYSVGNPGLGSAIAIASLSIPFTAFTSVQTALFRRRLNFKSVFYLRIPGILIPLFVTVPLAFVTHSYWAMIIGTLLVSIVNAVLFTIKSNWKPRLNYSVKGLKRIFSFSFWAFLEQLLGWANLNIGIFIVGLLLSPYYLGLFKTSMAIINQLYAIVINSFSPVLLATLSRFHDNRMDNEYRTYYYSFIRYLSIIMLPLGIGVFVFREYVTILLLGSQWVEAADFIGLWGLFRAIWCLFGIFSTEIFISSGKPQYSVYIQIIQLSILTPTLLLAAQQGYTALYLSRTAVVVMMIIVESIMLYQIIDISPMIIIKSTWRYFVSAVLMGGFALFAMKAFDASFIWQSCLVFISMLVYFGCIMSQKKTREEISSLIKIISSKKQV